MGDRTEREIGAVSGSRPVCRKTGTMRDGDGRDRGRDHGL